MTSLLVVGIAVAVFGGLVLLKFPERPGGRIAWHGFEVSSVGAGMPLMVVGVTAVAIAAVRGGTTGVPTSQMSGKSGPAGSTATSGSSAGCSAFRGIPQARVRKVEEGANGLDVIGTDQSQSAPFVLKLTQNDKEIGGIRARWIASSSLFKIESVVDADCKPTESFSSGSSNRHDLQNYGDLLLNLGSRHYDLNLGIAGGAIQVDYFKRFRP